VSTHTEAPAAEAGLPSSEASSIEAQPPGRRWWPAGLCIAIVLIGLSLVVPAGRHQWALAIVRQPTPYTALAFQDPASVPTALQPDGSLAVSFTITNNEGRQLRYAFVVTSTSGSQIPTVLQRGTVQVPGGARGAVAVSVKPVCHGSPCTVAISLPGHPETIDALVNLSSPKP
jgi:hypothetical protein